MSDELETSDAESVTVLRLQGAGGAVWDQDAPIPGTHDATHFAAQVERGEVVVLGVVVDGDLTDVADAPASTSDVVDNWQPDGSIDKVLGDVAENPAVRAQRALDVETAAAKPRSGLVKALVAIIADLPGEPVAKADRLKPDDTSGRTGLGDLEVVVVEEPGVEIVSPEDIAGRHATEYVVPGTTEPEARTLVTDDDGNVIDPVVDPAVESVDGVADVSPPLADEQGPDSGSLENGQTTHGEAG
jgi:hypothetical protein